MGTFPVGEQHAISQDVLLRFNIGDIDDGLRRQWRGARLLGWPTVRRFLGGPIGLNRLAEREEGWGRFYRPSSVVVLVVQVGAGCNDNFVGFFLSRKPF